MRALGSSDCIILGSMPATVCKDNCNSDVSVHTNCVIIYHTLIRQMITPKNEPNLSFLSAITTYSSKLSKIYDAKTCSVLGMKTNKCNAAVLYNTVQYIGSS